VTTPSTPPPDDAADVEVILVDALDRETGRAAKRRAHAGDGMLHRAISLYLFDDRGRVLLQRRASAKPLWPGGWSNACCTHPRPGESALDACRRRAREELGVDVEPSFAFRYSYAAAYRDVGIEREVCHVFTGSISDASLACDPSEVASTEWRDAVEVLDAIERDPDAYTPWFRIAFRRLRASRGRFDR
jgi:isopentenyl-diphosphate delta-isomerase